MRLPLASKDRCALMSDILNRGAALKMRVTGGSMRPLVPTGTRVVIRPVRAEGVTRGDVILFRNAVGAAVLHRVIRIDAHRHYGRVFRTKGDAQLAFDDPVTPFQVMGRAVMIERNLPLGGTWTIALDGPVWRRIGAGIAVVQLAGAKMLLKLLQERPGRCKS